MSKDYKNSGKRKTAKRKPIPGWLWLLTGLSVGLLAALLVFLIRQPDARGPQAVALQLPDKTTKAAPAKSTHKSAKSAKAAEAEAKKKDGVKFEFYTLLPESEVVVPEQELSQRPAPAGKPVKAAATGTYTLQAGSFRSADEARALKAELALLGVVADVQDVNLNGDIWHRVRIGPYSDVADVNKVRERLRRNKINTIPLRVKG